MPKSLPRCRQELDHLDRVCSTRSQSRTSSVLFSSLPPSSLLLIFDVRFKNLQDECRNHCALIWQIYLAVSTPPSHRTLRVSSSTAPLSSMSSSMSSLSHDEPPINIGILYSLLSPLPSPSSLSVLLANIVANQVHIRWAKRCTHDSHETFVCARGWGDGGGEPRLIGPYYQVYNKNHKQLKIEQTRKTKNIKSRDNKESRISVNRPFNLI